MSAEPGVCEDCGHTHASSLPCLDYFTLNAAGPHPPPGGVPAARPEGEPGAAAVFVEPDSPTWPYVLGFALLMEAKLEANRHKGDRDGWIRCSVGDFLLPRLREEFGELCDALPEGAPAEIAAEAADVANFAMMIADVCGGLVPVAKRTHHAPEGLAARMRAEIVHDREHHGPMCRFCGDLRDATPAAVAALDNALAGWRDCSLALTRALEERRQDASEAWGAQGLALLRSVLNGTLGRLETLCVECGPGIRVDPDGLCETCGATSTGAWLSSHIAAARGALGGEAP